MVLCGVCVKECIDANGVKCTGGCENVFHINCVNKDSEGKIKRTTKDWKCSMCRNRSSTHGSTKSSTSTSEAITKDFLVNVLEAFKKEVFAEIVSFKGGMSELSTSVQFVSDKLDASNVLMEEIRSKLAELQKENISLKTKNETLSKEVIDLRERMRSLEQYSRVNNVEVSGIPVSKNENISDLVVGLGAALGVEVKEMDVAAAHRVPSFKKDREPALIVQFATRGMKEQWVIKARQKKGLTARDVNQYFPVQRVYVNDHLSPENKQFLAKLKQKGRDLGYKFVWSRDGKFFTRKAEGDPVRKIITYDDMDKLK